MADQLSSDLASLQIPREGPPGPSSKSAALRKLALVGLSIGALGGVYAFAAPRLESKIFRQEISATEISLVSPVQSSVELTSTGYVAARLTSKVGAKVQGRIAKVHVKEGDQVKEGDLLVELEDADSRSAIAAARARAAAARARTEAAKANLSEGRIQADRQRTLAKSGAAAMATVENLEARAKSLGEAVKVAEAEVQAQEAEVTSLSVNLQYLSVRAPIGGTVVTKPAEIGEMVGPQLPLVEMADFSTLLVETDVPEARLHFVKIGGPCEIVLDAYPAKRHRCEAVEIVPRVNRSKATVTVKVKFVDALDGVLPDMAARVSFLEKPLDQAEMKEPPKLVVPSAAVIDRGGSKAVFVLDGDQVHFTPVSLGPAFGAGFELLKGPREGTRVVRDPPATLEDGQRIKEKLGS